MGKCRFCQKDAGRLRRRHPGCRSASLCAVKAIPQMVMEQIAFGADIRLLRQEVQAVADLGYVPPAALAALVVQGWDKALDAFLYADGAMTPAQAQRLHEAACRLQIEPGHLRSWHIARKLARTQGEAAAPRTQFLQQIRQGDLPEYDAPAPPCFIPAGERLVWVFSDVTLYEEEARTGQRILEERDTGALSLTTRHLIFAGGRETRWLSLRQVTTLEPFDGALGVMADGAAARRQLFTGLDGEVTYALALRLARDARRA